MNQPEVPDILISLIFAFQTIMTNKDRLQEHQSDPAVSVLFSVSVSILRELAFTFPATLTTHHSAGTGLLPCMMGTQRPYDTIPHRSISRYRFTYGYSVLSAIIHLFSNAYTSAYIQQYFQSAASYSLIPVRVQAYTL